MGTILDLPTNLASQLDQVKPDTARRLVVLTFVSITIAVGWIVAVSQVVKGPIAWAPGLAFGALAAISLAMATIQAMTFTQKVVTSEVVKIQDAVGRIPKPAAYHIGCRIGRRRLECGLLEVTAPTQGLPDDIRKVRFHEVEHRNAKQGGFQHAELYEALVDTLMTQIKRADNQRTRIECIGLALPGGVHPERGEFADAVHRVAFKANDKVSIQLANRLRNACDKEVLERVFGAQGSDKLTSIIHLDNDARCAARWLITERAPTWRDFACVFAGQGIGSGLVFDRRTFYGASFRAGEVGHVNLNLGHDLNLNGKDIQPRKCSCGTTGYHFESLASIGGLGHLAGVMGASELKMIRTAYYNEPSRAQKLKVSMFDQADADGIIMLNALEAGSEMSRDDVVAKPEISDYLSRVTEQYAKLFSVGLTALLDALDVNHVALCGTIPEHLQGNRDFTQALREGVARASMSDQPAAFSFGSMRQWGWRGAAMLSRDRGYMARRFPNSLASPTPEEQSDVARQASPTQTEPRGT